MNATLQIKTPKILKPMLMPSRYKAIFGGRGSMKSHFFSELGIERALMQPGFRMVCVREVQKSLKESAKRLLEDKINKFEVNADFSIMNDEIRTPGGGIILFQGLSDHTAESIKSLEGFDVAWVEEGQTLSNRSLEFLRPTIRKEGSELWFGWNPRNASDPVDKFFRGMTPPQDSIIIRTSFEDNPWFPGVMEGERIHDLNVNKDRYGHIWLGNYEPTALGAIWNRQTLHSGRRFEVPTMGRIVVGVDPSITDNENSDETGIIVAGVGEDNRGYVLEDASKKGGPSEWAQRVVAVFDYWEADAIVVEINQGGLMVRNTLLTVRPDLPIIEVRATKGKHVRAEPIAALYSLEKISHVGTFEKLEDQMCKMTPYGYEGNDSPDRCDAMIWAFTNLFPKIVQKSKKNHDDIYRNVPKFKRFGHTGRN